MAALASCACTGFTSCNDYLEEKPEHIVSPDQLGDSQDACDQWVTGVYSKWINDMFRWSNFPKVLELDTDYISGPDWCFSSIGAGNFHKVTLRLSTQCGLDVIPLYRVHEWPRSIYPI